MTDIIFPFLEHTGAKLKSYAKGSAEVELHVQPYHLQHMGFIHGGVISTLMDNTGWYAAVSNLEPGFTAVTMEIKINYVITSYSIHYTKLYDPWREYHGESLR